MGDRRCGSVGHLVRNGTDGEVCHGRRLRRAAVIHEQRYCLWGSVGSYDSPLIPSRTSRCLLLSILRRAKNDFTERLHLPPTLSVKNKQKPNFLTNITVKYLEATALHQAEQRMPRDLIGLLYIGDAAIGREIQSVIWQLCVFTANSYIRTCQDYMEWICHNKKWHVWEVTLEDCCDCGHSKTMHWGLSITM